MSRVGLGTFASPVAAPLATTWRHQREEAHDEQVGSSTRSAVVVGVDGSVAADRALDVAIDHAQRLHRPLHVVHATGIGIVPWNTARLAAQDRVADEAAATVRAAAPDLLVTRETVIANPAAALVEASTTADLIVLASGGLGHAAGVVLGAAAHAIAAHARCPVVLTPRNSEWSATGPVVLGMDASEESVPALEWAFGEASTRAAPLNVVHTWWWEEPDPFVSGPEWDGKWQDVVTSQRLEVAEMLAGWQDKYPDVQVTTTVVRGHATSVLTEESRDAQLLVVGTRGRGGFTSLLLGSVSASLIAQARCPLTVVPSTSRTNPRTSPQPIRSAP